MLIPGPDCSLNSSVANSLVIIIIIANCYRIIHKPDLHLNYTLFCFTWKYISSLIDFTICFLPKSQCIITTYAAVFSYTASASEFF